MAGLSTEQQNIAGTINIYNVQYDQHVKNTKKYTNIKYYMPTGNF